MRKIEKIRKMMDSETVNINRVVEFVYNCNTMDELAELLGDDNYISLTLYVLSELPQMSGFPIKVVRELDRDALRESDRWYRDEILRDAEYYDCQ